MPERIKCCCICGKPALEPTDVLFRCLTIPMPMHDVPSDGAAKRHIRYQDMKANRETPRCLRISIEIPDGQDNPNDAFCAGCARAALLRQARLWTPAVVMEEEEE